jgi:hypothetical protein
MFLAQQGTIVMWIWQKGIPSRPWVKIAGITLCALFMDAAYLLLIGSIPGFGSSTSPLILLSLLIGIAAIFCAGWINSHSIRLGIGGVAAAVVLGIPTATYFLQPLTNWFWTQMTPFGNAAIYGAINYIGLIILLIVPVLAVNCWRELRTNWIYFLMGIIFSVLIVSIIEVISLNRLGSDASIVRGLVYTPWLWFWAGLGIHIRG